MHEHAHWHHDGDEGDRSLLIALALTLGYAAVEALGGWWSGSLALLSDAGHMVTDATALGLAALAAAVARRPPDHRHSYGMARAEIVAALINSLFMLLVVVGVVSSAVNRLQAPRPVAGETVIAVALVGLLVNIAVALLLSHGTRTLNTRAAFLHVLGDLLGSIAALASGAVITATGWTPVDPLLSLLICALILYSSLRLLREVLHVIMEGVPLHLSLPEVGQVMAQTEGVASVHDLHIWTLASGRVVLSAHVVVQDMAAWEATLARLREALLEGFAIDHVTLQPEPAAQVLRPMAYPGNRGV